MCCTRLAGNAGPNKSPKFAIWAPSQICRAISSQLSHVSTIGKSLLNSNVSPTCSHNMVNFSPLAAEIRSLVWGTPANINCFRVLASLLHGTLVVSVSQTLRHWTEGATYIRQGGNHIGHYSCVVCFCCVSFSFFFSTSPRDWLERTFPKWPILCRVGRKNLIRQPTAGRICRICCANGVYIVWFLNFSVRILPVILFALHYVL